MATATATRESCVAPRPARRVWHARRLSHSDPGTLVATRELNWRVAPFVASGASRRGRIWMGCLQSKDRDMSVYATEEMAFFCFDTLVSYLDKSVPAPRPTFPNHRCPLFVTWHLQEGASTSLRGCIGCFSDLDIHSGLSEYTITSSQEDRRFEPIRAHEIPSLHCAVSLLTNFEDARDCYDWEVGKHGIWIHFTDPKGVQRSGTYLPEVMPEAGWRQEEALVSLVRKAGWKGTCDKKLLSGLKLTRYQSSKVNVSYSDYVQYKKLASGRG